VAGAAPGAGAAAARWAGAGARTGLGTGTRAGTAARAVSAADAALVAGATPGPWAAPGPRAPPTIGGIVNAGGRSQMSDARCQKSELRNPWKRSDLALTKDEGRGTKKRATLRFGVVVPLIPVKGVVLHCESEVESQARRGRGLPAIYM